MTVAAATQAIELLVVDHRRHHYRHKSSADILLATEYRRAVALAMQPVA